MSKLDITIYDLFGEKGDSGYVLVDAKKINEYINLAKALEVEHEAFKKTPTADEVCKALSEYFGRNVYYESVYFLYRKEEIYNQPFIIAYKHKSGLVELTKNVLPPHLIVMLGRFYERLEV